MYNPRQWDFLTEQKSMLRRNPIYIKNRTKVGFPSHSFVRHELETLGRPDAFESYAQSTIGRGTRLTGGHHYGVNRALDGSVALTAVSVAQGWLFNADFWVAGFGSTYYPNIHRKQFLTFGHYPFDSTDSYFNNAAHLWGSHADGTVPDSVKDSIRVTFMSRLGKTKFEQWNKCVMRANLSPADVVDGTLLVPMHAGAYEQDFMPLTEIVLGAEKISAIEFDKADFAAWMFFCTQATAGKALDAVTLTRLIAESAAHGHKPTTLWEQFSLGVPVQTLLTAVSNDIDFQLADFLSQAV
jgi:hypothetical protein